MSFLPTDANYLHLLAKGAFRGSQSSENEIHELDAFAGSGQTSGPGSVPIVVVDEETRLNEPAYSLLNVTLSSVRQTTINSINLLMGIGLLSIPYALSLLGWGLGLGLLVFFSAIACYTASLLGRLMRNDSDGVSGKSLSMYDIAEDIFGSKGKVFIMTILTLDLYLVAVANCILFADSLISIFPTLDSYKSLLKAAAVVFLTPVTFNNSMSKMSWMSSVGVFSLLCLIVVVFIDGLSTTLVPGSLLSPSPTTFEPKSWQQVGLASGLLFAGLNAHAAFPTIYSQMKKPQKFGSSMRVTYTVVAITYGIIGTVGYLMFGDAILPEISQNLPGKGYNSVLTFVALFSITLNPLTKFPLVLHPVNSSIEQIFKVHPRNVLWSRCLTSLSVLLTAIFIPSFQTVIGFIGSAFSFFIVVVFPCFCYLKLQWTRMMLWERLWISLLCVAGIFWMVFGTMGVVFTAEMHTFSKQLLEQVHHLSKAPQTSVSLRQMVQFGRTPSPLVLYNGSQFLLRELPIRLAHRVVELENLPHDLSKMPSVQLVRDWYTQSTKELLEFAEQQSSFGIPADFVEGNPTQYYLADSKPGYQDELLACNQAFVSCIDHIKKRHSPTTQKIATGVLELKEHWKRTSSPLYNGSYDELPLPTAIQSFLDNFYMSRIGIRMLIGQHISISSQEQPVDYVGIICTKTNLADVVEDAIGNAQFICQNYYDLYEAPKVKIIGLESVQGGFMYVPSHLHHMMFELLKNSMRAVVERFSDMNEDFPEIKLVVAQGVEDITIKISDEGGGIPRSGMPLIWTYMYTTANKPEMDGDDTRGDFRAPLAGFGYGLPLSRLYARYFGGDLRLLSMEGYGTDVKLARHNLTGQQVAIKVVDKLHAPYLVREIETWRQLHHPNITKLYEVLTSETKIYMVMEFCHGGEMLEYITQHGKMDDGSDQTKRIFLQISEAVSKCHEMNFAHRDLKLENILLTKDFNVKLIDFGFTRWANDSALLDTYCGSSAYCAPEIVAGQKYTGPEADIWSLGVILYTMVVGYLPFDADSDAETHKQIREVNYTIPDFVCPEVQDLISKIFIREPKNRISLPAILDHPWLASIRRDSTTLSLSSPAATSSLGKTSRELLLAAKLEGLGFNVPSVLEAVQGNACNQLSGLWHLLLEKTSTEDSELGKLEINVSDIDPIFENAQRTRNLENPLLHLASFDKEAPKTTQSRPKSASDAFKSLTPHPLSSAVKVVGGRKHKAAPVAVPPPQQYPLRSTGSAGILRASERMKSMGIAEEEESPVLSPLLE
ncbi:hypothetical protein HDU91_003237 [Kappamyces sp. JEL0680]|nr:hypothetical protein HDU91_003237 [Kappamyces sp. JEL0680]